MKKLKYPLSSFSPRYSWPARSHQPGISFREPGSVPSTCRTSPLFNLPISFLVRRSGIGQLNPLASRTELATTSAATCFTSLMSSLLIMFHDSSESGILFEYLLPLYEVKVEPQYCTTSILVFSIINCYVKPNWQVK